MLKKSLLVTALALCAGMAKAQDPMLTNWWFNTTNNTYNGILTDVEAVYYDAQKVYVKTSGVPNYYLDGQSVNNAMDLEAIWTIPRVPVPATTPASIQGGQNGLMLDGSVSFTPGDAQSYMNQGNWNRLAYYFEGNDMDNFNGHSTPNKVYHHHFDNLALHTFDSSSHSPLVGYAWDGYPIYGPFGFANTDGTGGITRMKSSYRTYTYTTRTNGPAVGGQYPIGCFIEDWEYVTGLGHLDEFNGRNCITPEYPQGTYAYFTTIDETLLPQYPYFIGPKLYGTFSNENVGPNGGNVTLPGGVTQYIPTAIAAVAAIESDIELFPIPVVDFLTIKLTENKPYEVTVYDLKGKVLTSKIITTTEKINMSDLPYGVYFVQVNDAASKTGFVKRIVKQ